MHAIFAHIELLRKFIFKITSAPIVVIHSHALTVHSELIDMMSSKNISQLTLLKSDFLKIIPGLQTKKGSESLKIDSPVYISLEF